jgi:hypothetical protein
VTVCIAEQLPNDVGDLDVQLQISIDEGWGCTIEGNRADRRKRLYMILYGKTCEPAESAYRASRVFNNLRIFNIRAEPDSDPRLQLKQKGSHLNSVVCDCCWILPYHSRASPFLPHFARQQPENRHRQPNRPPNASATSAGRPFL